MAEDFREIDTFLSIDDVEVVEEEKPKKEEKSSKKLKLTPEQKKKLIRFMGIFFIALMIGSVAYFAYSYYTTSEAVRFKRLQAMKYEQVEKLFTGPLANDTVKQQLLLKIKYAKSVEELEAIDVEKIYQERYQQYLEEQKRAEEEKRLMELNDAKAKLSSDVNVYFAKIENVFLANNDVEMYNKAGARKVELLELIANATSISELDSINPDFEAAIIYMEYLKKHIATLPGDEVVVYYGGEDRVMTKDEVIEELAGVMSVDELLKYSIAPVEYVYMAVLVPRKAALGGYLEFGSDVVVYGKDFETQKYVRLLPKAKLEFYVLTYGNGIISLQESQQVTDSSTDVIENTQQNIYNVNDNNSTIVSGVTVTQQDVDQDTHSISYSTDLAELLKAIAAERIQNIDEIKEKLENYGVDLAELEKKTQVMALPEDAVLFVVLKVPEVAVDDILYYQEMGGLYIAEIAN